MKSSVYKVQGLTQKKLKVMGADGIYAANKNRNFVTKHWIKTDFKLKVGKPKNYKEEQKIKHLITKERATRLEGEFWHGKGILSFKKGKSQNKENRNTLDILWNTY